jgi:hypothetical protein
MSDVMLKLTRGDKFVILDTFQNDSIAVNKLFSDVTTFEIRGSFSQTFRIPLTANNAEFFGAVDNPNFTSFDFQIKIEAELCVGTIPIYNGYCQIKKVVSKEMVDTELELIFFADTPSLTASLREKKISELSALSSLNHEMTHANVVSPPANTLWTLIERGQKFSQDIETPSTRQIFNTNTPLYVGDLTPAVNALFLWKKIFEEAGFTYNSTFIDDTLVDYWVVLNNSEAVKTTLTPETVTFAVTNAADYDFTAFTGNIVSLTTPNGFDETFDNGNNVLAGVFTTPYYAQFTFRFLIKVKKLEVGTSPDSLGIRLINPTTNEVHIAVDGTSNYSCILYEDDTSYTYQFTKTYLFNEGEQVALVARVQGGGDWTIEASSGFELVTTSTPIQGGDVDMNANAPDYKQVDFIRDMIKAHYLVFIPDLNEPKKINVEPFSTYIGSGIVRNWTKRIQLKNDKDIVIYPTSDIQNKKLKFTYTAGGEYLSEIFTKQGSRVYGQKEINNTSNDFATGEQRVELTLRSTPCNEIPGTSIPVPKFVNEAGAYIVPGARMLYSAGTASVALFNEVSEVGELTEVPILSHYSNILPSVTDYDLNFAPETALQVINSSPFNNLYNLYYSRSYNELYSAESRIMEAYFSLPLTEFRQLQFSDKIFIKDTYWRVLEIGSYFVGRTELTFIKLAKLVGEIRECEFIPYAITTAGKVLFRNGADESVSGNQTCCARYGYQWDADRGECFASALGGRERTQLPSPQDVTASLSKGFNNSVSGSSNNPIITGDNNTIGVNSPNSGVLGSGNEITDDAGTTLVVGQSVKALHSGVHYGNSETPMRAQGGVMILQGEGDYTASNDGIEIQFNGNRLSIDDGSVWACELSVALIDAANNQHAASFAFMINKDGTSGAGTVTTIFQNGALNIISLGIDTISDTAQHRFKINSAGILGYPFNDVKISGSLKYTQVK